MSHKHPGSPNQDASDERKLPQRARQPPVTSPGEPPARRSWRPCQMQGQDGEPNPHHHHHPHQHRGHPRQRRRLPSGQGRSPAVTPPTPEESRDKESPPVHQHRPAVSRYRRPGEPRPRPRQPSREVPNPSPTQEQLPPEDQLQDQASPPQQLDRTYPRHRLDRGPPPRRLDWAPPNQQQLDKGSPPQPQDKVFPPQQQVDWASSPQRLDRESSARRLDRVSPPHQLDRGPRPQRLDIESPPRQQVDRGSPARRLDKGSLPHQLDRGSSPRRMDRASPPQLQERAPPPQQQVAKGSPTHQLDRGSPPCWMDRASPPQPLESAPPPLGLDQAPPPQQPQTSHFSQDTPPDVNAPPCAVQANDAPETDGAAEEADSDGDTRQAEPDVERPPEATCDETANDGLLEAGHEEDERGGGVEEDEQGGEVPDISDLCSDTESAASLSLDGPLHSPPPLHSPSPPSSPDATPFPPHDHFSEDAGSSPPPDDSQPLPEEDEEEDDEEAGPVDLEVDEEGDCSDWCSLDAESQSESYPKTYADFYSESYPKVAPPQSKPPPSSFPEPLRTSYPSDPPQEEPRPEPRASHPRQNVHRGAPPPFTKAPRPTQRPGGRSRGSGAHSPLDHSVGCRLHHYDGSSDGEREGGAERSPVARGGTQQRGLETREGSPPSGRSSPADLPENTISMAIKDIKEAIEEVKIRTVRSPYTPDSSVEPVWVMRQEVSPSEEACSDHHPARCSSPHSPSHSESPPSYASAPARHATVSPVKQAAPSRGLHPRQHRPHQPQLGPGHGLQEREASGPLLPNQHHHHHQQQQQRERSRLQQQQPPLQQAPPPQQQQQQPPSVQDIRRSFPQFPTFVDVPGPCDPEDLIDGIIFAATYLGCTHLLSERTPTKSARMQQAQEAWNRVRAAHKQAKNRKKSPESDDLSTAEVDLFMSTQRIKVLNADTQESLMDLPLRTISYIADIGNMVVLMARGKMVRSRSAQEHLEQTAEQSSMPHDDRRLYRMICHVFESEDAKLIAQSIGQSFSVAYQEFLRANGIDPDDLSQREYSDLLNTQDMYNDDLIHFSKSENCRDVYIEKQKGEMLGVVIVESGWGSILPTVIIASMMHAGPAEKSGRLNIGDQIMTVNGTSLVGLPLSTCQSIIKGLKSQSRIKMNIVRCPPVTMVLIRRPDLRYQLGFSVQNGIICSLMRGGIAERGGVRVGHRIIEINGQSVVATPHEKIVQILSNAMGEIHMKTMPAAMYRLLTAQEQPVYI